MFSRLTSAAGVLLLLASPATAAVTTIALTDGAASGTLGGEYLVLYAGSVNEVGEIVFSARLRPDIGDVNANNDTGLWLFDGSNSTLLARKGIGNVPEVPGGNFSAFHAWGIDDEGGVALRATLADDTGGVTSSNDEGIWRFTGAEDSLVARTGIVNMPHVANASFNSFPPTLYMGRDGQIAHTADLVRNEIVSSDNDRGLWTHDLEGTELTAREGLTSVPGVSGGRFLVFGEPSVNNHQQLAFRGSLKQTLGGVIVENDLGVWRYTDSTGTLLAREQTGGAPGVDSAKFDNLRDPVINGSGQVAFLSTLTTGGSVDATNNTGVWLYDGTTGALLARTGVGDVPGVPDSRFAAFDPPLLSDLGQALVRADLVTGPGDVTDDNDLGLWMFGQDESSLVARTGSDSVPGVSGASFFDFDTLAMNAQGLVAVRAYLRPDEEDVGLWLLDSTGGGMLVAREGDPLAGLTIKDLSFLGNSGGNDGRPSGLNDRGQLAFQATFTNDDSGLFLFSPYTSDFDRDGDVDTHDLTHSTRGWITRFGDDLDGNDFLTWQQQFGSGTGVSLSALAAKSSAVAIPEPASGLSSLAILIAGGLLARPRFACQVDSSFQFGKTQPMALAPSTDKAKHVL